MPFLVSFLVSPCTHISKELIAGNINRKVGDSLPAMQRHSTLVQLDWKQPHYPIPQNRRLFKTTRFYNWVSAVFVDSRSDHPPIQDQLFFHAAKFEVGSFKGTGKILKNWFAKRNSSRGESVPIWHHLKSPCPDHDHHCSMLHLAVCVVPVESWQKIPWSLAE